MKKLFILSCIFCFGVVSYGQITNPPDTTKSEFKNVIGVDATGLLQQFLNLSEYNYWYVPYHITYKRILKSNAIRLNLGGNISASSETSNDTSNTDRTRKSFLAGIGFEHYSYINKNCNVYFGVDAIYRYGYTNYHSWDNSRISKQKDESHGYGLSPFLGFQFKFWKRISIAVESSYDILYSKSTSSNDREYPGYPEYIDRHDKSESSGISTRFNPPVTIRFMVHL